MKKMIFYCTLLFSSNLGISICILSNTLKKYDDTAPIFFVGLFLLEFIISLIFAILENKKNDL